VAGHDTPAWITGLNDVFDRLPRTRVRYGSWEAPFFRACGVTGYYAALIVTLGAALLVGRSLLLVSVLALACAVSFFAWLALRRLVGGIENLVLLEHVWVALAACAGILVAIHEPVLPYLDVLVPGLSVFLAAGRIGCLSVGCCHGQPAPIGIRYTEECSRDGFPAHLIGVRLFPVQVLEFLGLTLIALSGLLALPFAQPGGVLAWFLAAYAVMRFGLERLRGDQRPRLLGLSQTRWMCLAQFGAALRLASPGVGRSWLLWAVLALALGAALLVMWSTSPVRRLLDRRHLGELAQLFAEEVDAATGVRTALPVRARTSSRGVSLAVAQESSGSLHLSVSLPGGARELMVSARLTAHLAPNLDVGTAREVSNVLQVRIPRRPHAPVTDVTDLAARLYVQLLTGGPAPEPKPSRESYFARSELSG